MSNVNIAHNILMRFGRELRALQRETVDSNIRAGTMRALAEAAQQYAQLVDGDCSEGDKLLEGEGSRSRRGFRCRKCGHWKVGVMGGRECPDGGKHSWDVESY